MLDVRNCFAVISGLHSCSLAIQFGLLSVHFLSSPALRGGRGAGVYPGNLRAKAGYTADKMPVYYRANQPQNNAHSHLGTIQSCQLTQRACLWTAG